MPRAILNSSINSAPFLLSSRVPFSAFTVSHYIPIPLSRQRVSCNGTAKRKSASTSRLLQVQVQLLTVRYKSLRELILFITRIVVHWWLVYGAARPVTSYASIHQVATPNALKLLIQDGDNQQSCRQNGVVSSARDQEPLAYDPRPGRGLYCRHDTRRSRHN